MTRRYTVAEREQAVRLVRLARADGRESGAVARVAQQLGFGVESVRSWVKDADRTDGTAGPDAQRVVESETENRELVGVRELKRANEILLKASTFSRRRSTAHPDDRRVHRREPRARSRAHLPNVAGGSEQLPRRQETPGSTVGEGGA